MLLGCDKRSFVKLFRPSKGYSMACNMQPLPTGIQPHLWASKHLRQHTRQAILGSVINATEIYEVLQVGFTLWLCLNSCGKSPSLIGKSTINDFINGIFSIATVDGGNPAPVGNDWEL